NPDNLWIPYLFKCPLVLSPHGGFHSIVGLRRHQTLKGLYFDLARGVLYSRVGAIHTVSPVEEDHVRTVLPDRPVYCIPQGPNIRAPLPAFAGESTGGG